MGRDRRRNRAAFTVSVAGLLVDCCALLTHTEDRSVIGGRGRRGGIGAARCSEMFARSSPLITQGAVPVAVH